MTQLVGRFVALAWPSSSFEGTKTYGICASSHMTGKCEMMSMGVISAARIRMLRFEWLRVFGEKLDGLGAHPFSPFLIPFTTSFTPRFT